MIFYSPVPPGTRVNRGWIKPAAHNTGHQGVDFDVPIGTTVTAAQDGEVSLIKYDLRPGSFGVQVWMHHDINGVKRKTLYAHLSAVLVSVGDKLQAGQIIGLSGSSGGTGPHLHFAAFNSLHKYASPINPGELLPRPNPQPPAAIWHRFNCPNCFAEVEIICDQVNK